MEGSARAKPALKRASTTHVPGVGTPASGGGDDVTNSISGQPASSAFPPSASRLPAALFRPHASTSGPPPSTLKRRLTTDPGDEDAAAARAVRRLPQPQPAVSQFRSPIAADDAIRAFDSFVNATGAAVRSALAGVDPARAAGPAETPARALSSNVGNIVSAAPTVSTPFTSLSAIRPDPELLEARLKVKTLMRELSIVKAEMGTKVIELEKQNAMYEVTSSEARTRMETLDKDRIFLLEREKKAAENLKRLDIELIETKREKDQASASYKGEVARLKERISELEEESRDSLRRSELQHGMSLSECDFETEAKKSAFQKIGELESRLSAVEVEAASLRMSDTQKDLQIVKKQLQDQLSYIASLESSNESLTREARALRARRDNVDRLREEKISLEGQLSAMSDLRRRLAAAEIEAATLRAEKSRWTNFLEGHDETGMESPYALSKALASERIDAALLKDKAGLEAAKSKALETQVLRLGEELEETRAANFASEEKYDHLLRASKRLERSRDMALQEVNFLREQLRSYDLEEQQMMPDYDRLKSNRINEQEHIIEGQWLRIKELENELHSQPADPQKPRPPTSSFSAETVEKLHEYEAEIERLKKENMMLQKEMSSLDKQVGILEEAVGRGVYDNATTRVLQLADNPEQQELSIRQSMLDALKAENASLIKQLCERGENGPGVVPIESLRVLEMDIEKLRALCAEKDKRMGRLKEVYKATAMEYKEAVFSLLGYKVDFQEGRVRLTSTFAGAHDASFLFTSGDGDSGTLQLVGGSGPTAAAGVWAWPLPAAFSLSGGGGDGGFTSGDGGLDACRAFYVAQCGSVPAFLAAVTLAWWERREREAAGGDAQTD
ncbi:coiled-coil domain-containing protein mad1 [Cladochytrium tenue]|nr:coiled-coil domain-containing protein mad1 [Cladochytrium tenue]